MSKTIIAVHTRTNQLWTTSSIDKETVGMFHLRMMEHFKQKVYEETPDTCPLAIMNKGLFLSDVKYRDSILTDVVDCDEAIIISPLALMPVPQMVAAHHNLAHIV